MTDCEVPRLRRLYTEYRNTNALSILKVRRPDYAESYALYPVLYHKYFGILTSRPVTFALRS